MEELNAPLAINQSYEKIFNNVIGYQYKVNNEPIIIKISVIKNMNKLAIYCKFKDDLKDYYYIFENSLEEFKNLNRYFLIFQSLNDILKDINEYFKENKNIDIEEDDDNFIININILIGRQPEKITLRFMKRYYSDKHMINKCIKKIHAMQTKEDELKDYIINLEKKDKDLITNLQKTQNCLVNTINNLIIENKKLKESNKVLDDKVQTILERLCIKGHDEKLSKIKNENANSNFMEEGFTNTKAKISYIKKVPQPVQLVVKKPSVKIIFSGEKKPLNTSYSNSNIRDPNKYKISQNFRNHNMNDNIDNEKEISNNYNSSAYNECKNASIRMLNNTDIYFNTFSNFYKPKTNQEINNYNQTFEINSDIIIDDNEINLIKNELFKLPEYSNSSLSTKLIYKATKNGGVSTIFHKMCDGIYPTLIVVKTTKNCKFGGFTTKAWSIYEGWKKDNSSFLFNLNTLKIYENKGKKSAINCLKNYGPIFNDGFCVYDNFLTSTYHSVSKNAKYVWNNFEFEYELNNGENNFRIEELEIFKIMGK